MLLLISKQNRNSNNIRIDVISLLLYFVTVNVQMSLAKNSCKRDPSTGNQSWIKCSWNCFIDKKKYNLEPTDSIDHFNLNSLMIFNRWMDIGWAIAYIFFAQRQKESEYTVWWWVHITNSTQQPPLYLFVHEHARTIMHDLINYKRMPYVFFITWLWCVRFTISHIYSNMFERHMTTNALTCMENPKCLLDFICCCQFWLYFNLSDRFFFSSLFTLAFAFVFLFYLITCVVRGVCFLIMHYVIFMYVMWQN